MAKIAITPFLKAQSHNYYVVWELNFETSWQLKTEEYSQPNSWLISRDKRKAEKGKEAEDELLKHMKTVCALTPG